MFDSDNNTYLTVDSLINMNSIITGLNNITLQKISVKPYGYDNICTDKNLTKDKQYQLVIVSIKRSIQWKKVNQKDFYFALLGINYFRTCKTLFYLQLRLY